MTPMVGGAIEKTIVTIPSHDIWLATIENHWKPIEYISTWTKTIDQFHHAKNWPSLWSSGHGTPHKALTIDRFHCARNWPSLWSMVSSNAQFILAQRCGFTREGAVVKNYAFGHSLQICDFLLFSSSNTYCQCELCEIWLATDENMDEDMFDQSN